MEYERIVKRLAGKGVGMYTNQTPEEIRADSVTLAESLTGEETELPCDAVVMVADRIPNDQLYQELKPALVEGKLSSLRVIGDAEAPHIIAQAVYSGYLAAVEFDEKPVEGVPFKVERTEI